MTSCLGCVNSSSRDKDRIAELEAQITELQSKSQNNQNNTDEISQSNTTSQSSPSFTSTTSSNASDDATNFLGTYKVVDKNGNTFYFIINQDETANVKAEGSDQMLYCSWNDLRSINKGIRIDFSDKRPILVFDGGIEKYGSFYLKDGWLYAGSSYVESKHPQWRLKADKIK